MKIVFLCNEYPPGPHGGVGTMTRLLGRALVEAGHSVRVIGLHARGYPAADYEDDQGVKVWRLREPAHRYGWARGRYQLYRAVARWVKSGDVDIVEAPDSRGWFAGWPRMRVPLVLRANGSYAYFAHELNIPLDPMLERLERWAYRRCDDWFSVTRYTADVTRAVFGLERDAAAILSNPVEFPEAPPDAERSRNRVVFTGTLTPKKGVISLIKGWPVVLERSPEAELHVYGKDGQAPEGGSMRAYLEGLLPPEARSRVVFHGHVAREVLLDALGTARAGVFPSYSETYGIAPIESMARGCPTIYTRRMPGPELVEDEVEGLLIDPDDPTAIGNAIVRLLQDDALAARLGAAGRERVRKEYALDVQIGRNVEAYQRCLERFHGSSRG